MQTTRELSYLKVHSWDSEPTGGDLEDQHPLFPPKPGWWDSRGLRRGWQGMPLTLLPSRIGPRMCGERFSGPGQFSGLPGDVDRLQTKPYIKQIKGLCSSAALLLPRSQGRGLMLGPRGFLGLIGRGRGRSDGEGGWVPPPSASGVWTELDPESWGLCGLPLSPGHPCHGGLGHTSGPLAPSSQHCIMRKRKVLRDWGTSLL